MSDAGDCGVYTVYPRGADRPVVQLEMRGLPGSGAVPVWVGR